MRGEFPYEQAAEPATVAGWRCRTCRSFWPSERNDRAEHVARYCCAKDMPCDCGGRCVPHHTACQACLDRMAAEEWAARPAVEWNGEFPIAIHDDDRYFFDAESLLEYLRGDLDGTTGRRVEDFRWTTCRPNKPRYFDIDDFLCDDLASDEIVDSSDINKVVNDWIKANVPTMYYGTGERISIESMRRWLPELEQ